MELDQNFYMPGIGMIYWFVLAFLILKNRIHKKVITILLPGIQPKDAADFELLTYPLSELDPSAKPWTVH